MRKIRRERRCGGELGLYQTIFFVETNDARMQYFSNFISLHFSELGPGGWNERPFLFPIRFMLFGAPEVSIVSTTPSCLFICLAV